MEKQIIISYDEYLRLEKCQNVLKDIHEELKYRPTYIDSPTNNSQILELNMPNSLKEFFNNYESGDKNILIVKFIG